MTNKQYVLAKYPSAFCAEISKYNYAFDPGGNNWIVCASRAIGKVSNHIGRGKSPQEAWRTAKEFVEEVWKP